MRYSAFVLLILPQLASAQATPFDEVYVQTSKLGSQELGVTIGRILDVALGFLGLIAFVLVLFGGFKWMTSGGDAKKIEEAKKIIFGSMIFLAVILCSWAISRFIVNSLYQATR